MHGFEANRLAASVFWACARHVLSSKALHVTTRVNRGEMLLDHGVVRDLFLAIVARAKKRYRFQVINFCVMGNHFRGFGLPCGLGAQDS